jgi:hypothetical protein
MIVKYKWMMVTSKNRHFPVLIFIQLVMCTILPAQIVSPFNGLSIQDTSRNYTFLVSGHFYGASTNASTFPASSLLANIDTLNSLNASFLMSLGDMFVDINDTYLKNYQKSLFHKLKMPLLNAVGNHDIANGNKYETIFGKEFFAFTKGTERFIILNTEINDGSIKNEQLDFLKEQLNPSSLKEITNIFIFSHRPVWAERIAKYNKLFLENTRAAVGSNNFAEVVKPLLMAVSKTKNLYWLSGSMGGGPASFFYDKEEETNVTFIQTAIRDLERDAALQVKMVNGTVSFLGISFTGQQLNKIEDYNIAYWLGTTAPENKFNYRLLPYLTLQLITHADFWIGFSVSVLLMLGAVFLKKRNKR